MYKVFFFFFKGKEHSPILSMDLQNLTLHKTRLRLETKD